MKPATENWLKIAAKDLKIAEASLKASEPLGVVFHLHASVEKTLKAIYEEIKGNPPKIHSLKKLAIDCCDLELKGQEQKFLDLLDKAFIDSRYPDDIISFETKYNISNCTELIQQVKEKLRWLKSLLKEN